MRLVHLSDTHLGFGAYSKLDPREGINQREADIYDAFRQAIDRAIELKPDLVIHAGDLFDTVRPQNRAIDFALRQLIRLSEAGIETVVISGNHSTPRLKETGSIFRIFEHLKGVHPIHEPRVGRVEVGDMMVHAIPHSATPPLAKLVSEAIPSRETGSNVLVFHAGTVGAETYRMDEFNEQWVPLSAIPEGFDYVALGHYHRMIKLRGGVYYSGSTERLGFGELGQDKGILEVDLGSGNAKFHKLSIRDMVELDALDASSMSSSEILREAKDRIGSVSLDDKIVRLTISEISQDAYRGLDVPALKRMGNSAVHFELKLTRREEEAAEEAWDVHIGTLAEEFHKYVSALEAPEEKRKKLLALGLPYLTEDQG